MNPSLPGGAATTSDGLAPDGDAWSASTRAGYTFVPYRTMQQGMRDAANPGALAIDVHLALVQATATMPTGTSIDVQLPVGSLTTTMLAAERTDRGIGDLEIRARQGLSRWLGKAIDVGATAGVVVPTGEYVPRSGAANLPPEALALTLGRGVAWWLAEIDARRAIGARATGLVQISARGPLGRASDDFAWGADVRGSVGGRIGIRDGLAFIATTDLQWRGRASEPDPFAGGRAESSNVGGWQWTVSPALQLTIAKSVAVVAGARIPILNDVVGRQLVPDVGGFVAVSYSRQLAARRPRTAPATERAVPAVATGQITIIDYWAEWCAPCATIDASLAAAAPRWADVRVVRVDASAWPGDGAPELPAGVDGLPVVEIFDAHGNRTLLVGEDATRVVEIVDELRRSKGTTP